MSSLLAHHFDNPLKQYQRVNVIAKPSTVTFNTLSGIKLKVKCYKTQEEKSRRKFA